MTMKVKTVSREIGPFVSSPKQIYILKNVHFPPFNCHISPNCAAYIQYKCIFLKMHIPQHRGQWTHRHPPSRVAEVGGPRDRRSPLAQEPLRLDRAFNAGLSAITQKTAFMLQKFVIVKYVFLSQKFALRASTEGHLAVAASTPTSGTLD